MKYKTPTFDWRKDKKKKNRRKQMNKQDIIKEFRERYDFKNRKLFPSIRELLKTALGILLVAGMSEWLEKKLKAQRADILKEIEKMDWRLTKAEALEYIRKSSK